MLFSFLGKVVKAPQRISFLVWTEAWGKILTCENLIEWGNMIVGWCCMYCVVGETLNQILIHCTATWKLYFFIIWDSVGFTIKCLWSYIWLEKLVWQAFVGYLEYCFVMLDVDYLEGTELVNFWDMESMRTQLLATFTSYLYEWARAWGFTTVFFLYRLLSYCHFAYNSFLF